MVDAYGLQCAHNSCHNTCRLQTSAGSTSEIEFCRSLSSDPCHLSTPCHRFPTCQRAPQKLNLFPGDSRVSMSLTARCDVSCLTWTSNAFRSWWLTLLSCSLRGRLQLGIRRTEQEGPETRAAQSDRTRRVSRSRLASRQQER